MRHKVRLMKKRQQRELAQERVKILLDKIKTNPEFRRRYIQLIEKICKKFRLEIPKELKNKYCKSCYNYFTSETCKIRIKNKKKVIICNCGNQKVFKY